MEIKDTRRAYVIWNVEDDEFKLRLDTEAVANIEDVLNKNLLDIISSGIPKMSDMLYILQQSMQRYQHGKNINDCRKLFDTYIDSGKSQSDFYVEVYLPLFASSGFFTQADSQKIWEMIEEVKERLK